MRLRHSIWLIIFSVMLINGFLYSQVYEDIEPTVNQFQIVRGSEDPGYNGDLNFSIPLMSVPSLGGLKYDINLQYVHGNGVPASESSSWVGLGWNLNLYQITCSPNFDRDTADDLVLTKDAPDEYFLSYPGGSTAIRFLSDNKWHPLNWSAIQITSEVDNNLSQSSTTDVQVGYKSFKVIDINGTRYIFDHRLKDEASQQLKHLCHPDPSYWCAHSDYRHDYFYVYKLTAILGANYKDGNGDDTPGNGGTDYGAWIKLAYDTEPTYNIYNYITRKFHDKQVSHLQEVSSPTHKATFNLTTAPTKRGLIFGGRQYTPYLPVLSSIELTGVGSTFSKKVKFVSSNSFGWIKKVSDVLLSSLYEYVESISGTGEYLLRLRLDELQFVDDQDDQIMPSYKFTYYNEPDLDDGDYCYLDSWGLLMPAETGGLPQIVQTTDDSTTDFPWMLREVTYPTGGKVEYIYETDRYQVHRQDYSDAQLASASPKVNYMGGVRIKQQKLINIGSGGTETDTYNYSYGLLNTETSGETGIGFLSGNLTLSGQDLALWGNSIGHNANNDVHYSDIQVERPDGSKIRKYYTSSFTGNGRGATVNSNYSKIYENITVEDDPYIDLISNTIFELYFASAFGGLYGGEGFTQTRFNKWYKSDDHYYIRYTEEWRRKAFIDESKEFDDYFVFLAASSNNNQSIHLFSNGWKRGHLTREEWLDDSDEIIQEKIYSYSMEPLTTERYKAEMKSGGNYFGEDLLLTVGWAKLTGTSTNSYFDGGQVSSSETYQYNTTNGLRNWVEVSSSDGANKATEIDYAFEQYTDMEADTVNMLSQISQQTTGPISGLGNYILPRSSTVTTWTDWYGNHKGWAPEETFQWLESSSTSYSLPTFNFSSPPGDSEWINVNTIISRNNHGLVTAEEDGLNNKTAYLWGYGHLLPIAVANNSTLKEFSCSSFDHITNTAGEWEDDDPIVMSEEDRWEVEKSTGDGAIASSSNENGFITITPNESTDPTKAISAVLEDDGTVFIGGKSYSISASVTANYSGAYIDISYQKSGQAAVYGAVKAYHTGSNEKELLNTTVTLPAGTIDWVRFGLTAEPVVSLEDEYVDFHDVRIGPADALIRSRTFSKGRQLLTSVSDENHVTTTFEYDDLGRLTKHQNADNETLSAFSYYFSRDGNSGNFVYTDPNSILTTVYQSDTETIKSKLYADALGRQVQSQSFAGSNDIISSTEYDELSRPTKAWKSILSTTANHAFEDNFITETSNYYDANGPGPDAGGYPYSKTVYEENSLDRVASEHSPGTDYHNESNPRYIRYRYDCNQSGEVPITHYYNDFYLAETIYKTMTIDEENREFSIFSDMAGNKVLQRSYNLDAANTAPVSATCSGGAFCEDTDTENFTLDIAQTVTWSCTLSLDPQYSIGEFKIFEIGQSASPLVEITTAGTVSNSIWLEAGDYQVSAYVEWTSIHGGGASVSGDVAYLDNTDISTTAFNYDILGNLITVYPPNAFDPPGSSQAEDWATNYTYNTLGKLIKKISPDAGTIEYEYDINSNLVRSEDAKRSAAGTAAHISYDFANRPLLTAIGSGTANDVLSEPADWLAINQYDSAPSSAIFPWTEVNWPAGGVVLNNLKNRLSGNAFKSNGEWQVELYSYDIHGQLETKYLLSENFDEVMITYQYDRQGASLEKTIDFGMYTFSHFYDYDDLGQLTAVYTSDNGTKPTLKDASFSYLPTGSLEDINLKEYSASNYRRTIDHSYHIRDWLTAIGDINNAAEPFAAAYGYLHNGNINQSEYYNKNSLIDARYRYNYSYDFLSRLTDANYDYYNGSWQTTSSRFDVNNFDYDPNGNILSLTRKDDNSATVDNLSYVYSNSNRLNSVTENAATTAGIDWDVETCSMTYDANGNMTSLVEGSTTIISLIIYDHQNLPTQVNLGSGTIVTYRYNSAGQRIYKKVGTEPAEHYILDGDMILGVYDDNGDIVFWNIFANGVVGRAQYQ